MQTTIRISFVIFIAACMSSHASSAGKLRSVRNATRSLSPSHTPKRQADQDREQVDRKRAAERSKASERQLAATAQAARATSQPRRPSRRTARQEHGGRHRQSRSPMRLGMHFYNNPISPNYETVVTEYVYTDTLAPNTAMAAPVGPAILPPCPRPMCDYSVVEPPIDMYSSAEHDVRFAKPWHVRFGAEYGSNTDDLSQLGFDLIANRHAGWGIETGIKLFQERDGAYRDHLWLGDFNIIYELFPTERFHPRAGIGVNWLADDVGAEAGLNLTLGFDAQLTEHFVVTGETDFGTLGDADLFHGRITAGLTQGPVEWFAGYDHRDIGGVELKGLVAGLRFRF